MKHRGLELEVEYHPWSNFHAREGLLSRNERSHTLEQRCDITTKANRRRVRRDYPFFEEGFLFLLHTTEPSSFDFCSKNMNNQETEELLLVKSRKQAAERLWASLKEESSCQTAQKDLNYLLGAVRGIIEINEEIWERCKAGRSQTTEGDFPFSRVSINPVTCKSKGNETMIKVVPKETTKDFGSPPNVPEILLEHVPMVIPEENKTGPSKISGLPRYDMVFGQFSALHPDVLVPYLLRLKEHLEDIQVFLGEIDSWLQTPERHATELEALIGKRPTIPKMKFELSCDPSSPPRWTSCVRCDKPFMDHGSCYRCPGSIDHQYGQFMVAQPLEAQVLYSFRSWGSYDVDFSLESEEAKQELKRFFDFLSSSSHDTISTEDK